MDPNILAVMAGSGGKKQGLLPKIVLVHKNPPRVTLYDWSTSGFGSYDQPSTSLSEPRCVAFSPAGYDIAVGGESASYLALHIWSPATGFASPITTTSPAPYPTDTVVSVAFSPAGDAIAVIFGSTLRVYGWSTGSGFTGVHYSVTLPSTGHNVAFSPTGGVIAVAIDTSSGLLGGIVYQWSISTGLGSAYTNPSTSAGAAATAVAFSPTGDAIAFADPNDIYTWDWSDSSGFIGDERTIGGGGHGLSSVNEIAFSPAGNAIAIVGSGLRKLEVYPWSTSTGFGSRYSDPTPAPSSTLESVAFSPRDDAIVVVGNLNNEYSYDWSSITGFGAQLTGHGYASSTIFGVAFSNF